MRVLSQKRGDVAVGLVTGNLEPIAWGKMQALGLLEAFSEPHFGGFGSDYCSGAHQAGRRQPACHLQRLSERPQGGKRQLCFGLAWPRTLAAEQRCDALSLACDRRRNRAPQRSAMECIHMR